MAKTRATLDGNTMGLALDDQSLAPLGSMDLSGVEGALDGNGSAVWLTHLIRHHNRSGERPRAHNTPFSHP